VRRRAGALGSKSPEQVAIEFTAEVRALKTMADYSANLTLNVPEYFKPVVMETFSKWQGKMVRIVAVQED
jgi:hypothetical protein